MSHSDALVCPPAHVGKPKPVRGVGSHSAHSLRSTKEILDLPRPTAALGYPVELTGVVTLLIPGEPQLFVQDSTGGISVMPRTVQGIKAGDVVLIEGKTAAGRFAPAIGEAHLTRLRHSSLPKPLRIPVDEFRPNVRGRYIEFEATVRSVFRVNERFQVNLSHDGQAVTARVYDSSEVGMPADPGDVIRRVGSQARYSTRRGSGLDRDSSSKTSRRWK